MLARFSFAFSVLLAGCSSSNETGPSTQPIGVPPAVEAPPVECAGATYRTAGNVCETFPALSVKRAATAIAPVRDHHSSIVIDSASGAYLYVFGGTDAWRVLHSDVQRAKVRDDGGLDPFEPAGNLRASRAGHCIVRVKDKLLLLGGVVGSGPSRSSVVVAVGGDGHIIEIGPGPELPKAVMHLTCDVAGDYVYALGGRGADSKSTTLSVRAKIQPDATLSAFEPQTPLTPDRSHHAAFVREKRLYVLGGLTGDPTGDSTDHSDAIVANIDADGKLGAWSPAGKLPETLSVSSAAVYKDAVYVFGGLESGGFSDKIRRATFKPDGMLTPFATLPARLPSARGHVHQTPMHKTQIFSIGGKDNSETSLGTIDIGRFD